MLLRTKIEGYFTLETETRCFGYALERRKQTSECSLCNQNESFTLTDTICLKRSKVEEETAISEIILVFVEHVL